MYGSTSDARKTKALTTVVAAVTLLSLMLTAAGCGTGNSKDKDPRAGVDSARAPVDPAARAFETQPDPPVQAKTHYAAGQLAESQNDQHRAIEQYWAAVKLDANYREPLFRLGIVYTQLRCYPDAIVAWKLYVKATHNDPTAHANLGFCYELADRTSEAEAEYKKGIDADPKNVPCRVNYGLLLARDNRINEATLQMQSVLTPAQVHYNLASAYEMTGRKQQAKAEFRKALELEPTLRDAQARLEVLE